MIKFIFIIIFSYGLSLYSNGENFPFGINNSVYKEFFENGSEGNKYREKYKQSMDMAVELGVKWWRPPYLFEWKNVQPDSSTQWKFEYLDSIVIWAGKRDLNILAVFGCEYIIPFWARNKKISYKYFGRRYPPDPKYWDEYENFIISLVERYDGDGKKDMPGLILPIKYWEFSNEPYGKYFLGTPEQFINMFKRTRKAIKEADPEAKIVGPCLTGDKNTLKWKYFDIRSGKETYRNLGTWEEAERFFLDSIGIDNIDVISHHIYRNPATTIVHINRLKEILKDNGGKDKPIWITELGIKHARRWTYKTYDSDTEKATPWNIIYYAKQGEVFACSVRVFNPRESKLETIIDTLLNPGDTVFLCDQTRPISDDPYWTDYTKKYQTDTIIYKGGPILKNNGDTVIAIGDKVKIFHYWIETTEKTINNQEEYYSALLAQLPNNLDKIKLFFFSMDNWFHKFVYPPEIRFKRKDKNYIPIFAKSVKEEEYSIIDTSNKPYPAYNTLSEYIKANY